MFTGIIEELGGVNEIKHVGSNITFKINCSFVDQLKVDQSIAHNGVCLTVTEIDSATFSVTAIAETLHRSNLGNLKINDLVNLERCLPVNGRIDGHFVQGHVDLTATCVEIIEENGSWIFAFSYDENSQYFTVEKGSICVNGVSLTVVESRRGYFSVAIIPFTYEHTNFKSLKVNDPVNIEFDVLGKYIVEYTRRTAK